MNPLFINEIVLRKNENFWIFSSNQMFENESIYSPWFSYMGQKWRFVKQKFLLSDLKFLLCTNVRSDPLKYTYTIQLKLKCVCRYEPITITSNIDLDYGSELNFGRRCPCNYRYISEHYLERNGQVKLIFTIQREKNINDVIERSKRGGGDRRDFNCYSFNRRDEPRDRYRDSSERIFPDRLFYDSVNDGKTLKENEENSENDESSGNEDEESSEDEESEVDIASSNDEKTDETSGVAAGSKGVKRLAENLKQVLLDERVTDVVLNVDDREFKVHKVVLVARSSAFASMFEHDLVEKNTNAVNIPDCTAESFEIFLHYVYSGSAETLSANSVYNVYYAADKYRVDDLKEECVKFMKRNPSVETFCDTIALSLRHGESKLQKAATRFFAKNIKKIIKTVQWQRYLAENSTQANELLIKALKA